MARLDPRIAAVTDRIIERSKPTRDRYLRLDGRRGGTRHQPARLSCGNFAHGFAAAGEDKQAIRTQSGPNLAIVTAYNDMLSAHQPYGRYPEQMKIFAREAGATAQVAGGTPAMCDGVTQGQPGMDLSLVQPRHDRPVDRGRAQSRHVRRRGHARHLRQDRPRPADRRAALRPPAGVASAWRAHAIGSGQQGKAADPPALCGGQGDQGRVAGVGSRRVTIRPAPAPFTAPPIRTK